MSWYFSGCCVFGWDFIWGSKESKPVWFSPATGQCELLEAYWLSRTQCPTVHMSRLWMSLPLSTRIHWWTKMISMGKLLKGWSTPRNSVLLYGMQLKNMFRRWIWHKMRERVSISGFQKRKRSCTKLFWKGFMAFIRLTLEYFIHVQVVERVYV